MKVRSRGRRGIKIGSSVSLGNEGTMKRIDGE